MSRFSESINQARGETAAKAARELESALRVHGKPEPHDLGALQSLRARFSELSGAEFEKVLQEVRGG